jgi:hypothetical protein
MQNTERGGLGDHPALQLVWQDTLKKESKTNDETYYTWEQWNTLLKTYKRKAIKS